MTNDDELIMTMMTNKIRTNNDKGEKLINTLSQAWVVSGYNQALQHYAL